MIGPEAVDATVEAGAPFVFVTGHLRTLFGGMRGAFGIIAKPYDDKTMRPALSFIAGSTADRLTAGPPRGIVVSVETIARLGMEPGKDVRPDVAAA